MAERQMKSDEVRQNWREVQEFVRSGGRVIVVHYNRPSMQIVPYKTEPDDREVFMRDLVWELADLAPRPVWDVDQGFRLVIPLGQEWVVVSRDQFGTITIQEVSGPAAELVGEIHSFGSWTPKEAAAAIRKLND